MSEGGYDRGMDYWSIKDRLRNRYMAPIVEEAKASAQEVKGEALGEQGFLTEVAGRVILTAPATPFDGNSELPKELASRWQEMASGNGNVLWLQGRFVEAEKANRNGAFWSTDDLQFGEMSVKHGPLNWLHEEKTVVGTIADNALVRPGVAQRASFDQFHDWAKGAPGVTFNGPADTYTVTAEAMATYASSTTNTITLSGLMGQEMPRPYIAAASAMWKWVHRDKVAAVERAAAEGHLYYSMECIAREMQCVSDETHTGCDKSFPYIQAMTQPESTCEHIAGRTSARRLVDPSFLGGAVIVPPVQPGWADARVEVMTASLAEQVTKTESMKDSEWEALMASVIRYATT